MSPQHTIPVYRILYLNGSRLVASIFLLVALTGCGVQIVSTPIPSGQVEIHVEYKNLSTTYYNELTRFIQDLARERSVDRRGSSYSGSHGFLNDGVVDARYKPNHPVPSPNVEKDMRTRLATWLVDRGKDPARATLDLRYGP